jgi:hypothetical protein
VKTALRSGVALSFLDEFKVMQGIGYAAYLPRWLPIPQPRHLADGQEGAVSSWGMLTFPATCTASWRTRKGLRPVLSPTRLIPPHPRDARARGLALAAALTPEPGAAQLGRRQPRPRRLEPIVRFLLLVSLTLAISLTESVVAAKPKPGLRRPIESSKQTATNNGAPTPNVETRWYGWQTLIADGCVMALSAADYALIGPEEAGALSLVAALTYWGATPIIHIEHEQGRRSGISVGLRLVLPLAGAISGLALAQNCTFYRCDGVAWGAATGMVSAMAIDAAFLAHEPVGSRELHDGSPARRGTSLRPTFQLLPGYAGLGLWGEL